MGFSRECIPSNSTLYESGDKVNRMVNKLCCSKNGGEQLETARRLLLDVCNKEKIEINPLRREKTVKKSLYKAEDMGR